MTSPRFVEHHVNGLRDIRAIMNSMKTLAYLETQKLSRMVPAQAAVTAQLDTAAIDLLAHYPQILPAGSTLQRIWIVLGTERGFCGNLNQRLLESWSKATSMSPAGNTRTLLVGHKLHTALRDLQDPQFTLIYGAGVTEEVPAVLNRITDELESLRSSLGPAKVSAIGYDSEGKIGIFDLLPPFKNIIPANIDRQPHKPLLNLSPERLLLELTDQYLFSLLFEILYSSLLTENRQRVQHLGDAVGHLDRQCAELTHRANALRQEQVTEEIEVLLLSIGLARKGTRGAFHASPVSAGPAFGAQAIPRRHSARRRPYGETHHD